MSGREVVFNDFLVQPGGFLRNTATCPAGKHVFGGGAAVIREGTANFHTVLQESTPGTIGTIGGGTLDVWLVAIQNNDTVAHTIRIEAVCAFAP